MNVDDPHATLSRANELIVSAASLYGNLKAGTIDAAFSSTALSLVAQAFILLDSIHPVDPPALQRKGGPAPPTLPANQIALERTAMCSMATGIHTLLSMFAELHNSLPNV